MSAEGKAESTLYMDRHIRVVAYLNILLGILGVISLIILLGSAAYRLSASGSDSLTGFLRAQSATWIVSLVPAVLSALLAIPAATAGIGLLGLRPWARTLGILVSAVNLLNFPIGTSIGIYSLWALFSHECEPLFDGRQAGRVSASED